jgi:hypothetical protein
MNDNIPVVELPPFATENLAHAVAFARENVSYRVGYEVELATIVPVSREGQINLTIHWRRKPTGLHLVRNEVTAEAS